MNFNASSKVNKHSFESFYRFDQDTIFFDVNIKFPNHYCTDGTNVYSAF